MRPSRDEQIVADCAGLLVFSSYLNFLQMRSSSDKQTAVGRAALFIYLNFVQLRSTKEEMDEAVLLLSSISIAI